MPQTAVAFDIYGTLADTGGVARALEAHTEDAAGFASRWRDKQLEYTFRRTVMGVYADFNQCTKEALLYVCAERGVSLTENQRANLTAEYARLPLFADALQALNDLRANDNLRLFAFSNGKAAAVQEWLSSRGVLECFVDVVSADEIKQFKPAPQVYRHFLARANASADSAWLVSGNPFDIIGAQNTGMRGAWIKRNNAVFDLWEGVKPTATISSLTELESVLSKPEGRFKTYKYKGTRYGGGRTPSLGKMVFDIINDWVEKHQPHSFGDLKSAFPPHLRGMKTEAAKDALFATKQAAEERYQEDPGHPRHVQQGGEVFAVRLGDGSEYAVSNQWGEIRGDRPGDIRAFVRHARNMGYEIEDITNRSP